MLEALIRGSARVLEARTLVKASYRSGLVIACRHASERKATPVQDVTLSTLQEEHRLGVVELLIDVFIRNEPTLNYLKAPYESVKYFKEIAVRRSIRDGIGTVAVDTKRNRVAGAAVVFLVSRENCADDDFRISERALLQPVVPVLDLFAALRARFYQLDEVKEVQRDGGKFMELYLGGVGDDYHGHNLLRRMLWNSIELGKARGAKMTYAEVTSPISRHVVATEKFVEVGDMIKFTEFEVNGQRPYSGMPPEYDGAVLSMKRL